MQTFNPFTGRARRVMALAKQEAHHSNIEYVGTEHLLLGLVKERRGVGANVLKSLGVDLAQVSLDVKRLAKSGTEMATLGKAPAAHSLEKVIEYAIDEAKKLNHNYVGTEHLLLGMMRESNGITSQVFKQLNLRPEEVRNEILNTLGAGRLVERLVALGIWAVLILMTFWIFSLTMRPKRG